MRLGHGIMKAVVCPPLTPLLSPHSHSHTTGNPSTVICSFNARHGPSRPLAAGTAQYNCLPYKGCKQKARARPFKSTRLVLVFPYQKLILFLGVPRHLPIIHSLSVLIFGGEDCPFRLLQ